VPTVVTSLNEQVVAMFVQPAVQLQAVHKITRSLPEPIWQIA